MKRSGDGPEVSLPIDETNVPMSLPIVKKNIDTGNSEICAIKKKWDPWHNS